MVFLRTKSPFLMFTLIIRNMDVQNSLFVNHIFIIWIRETEQQTMQTPLVFVCPTHRKHNSTINKNNIYSSTCIHKHTHKLQCNKTNTHVNSVSVGFLSQNVCVLTSCMMLLSWKTKNERHIRKDEQKPTSAITLREHKTNTNNKSRKKVLR